MPQIRNHPKLSSWPPGWGGSYRGADKLPIGEVGTLVSVKLFHRHGPKPAYVRLEIEYEGNRASGLVTSEDEALLARLEAALANAKGMAIEQVGDIDVV